MKKIILGILVGISAFAMAKEEPELKLVTELKKSTVYEGHLFHAKHLWVGHDRGLEEPKHRIEVYANDGTKRISTIYLSHTPTHIQPYDNNSVVVMGKSYTDQWRTHFSILEVKASTAKRVKTFTFPIKYQMYEFGGSKQTPFFAAPGSRAIYTLKNNRVRRVGPDFYFPNRPLQIGNYLWIIEGHGPGLRDENLARLDLKTGKAKRVFPSLRNGLSEIQNLPVNNLIAVSETRAGSILFIDKSTLEVKHRVNNLGDPRGLAVYGNCLVSVSEYQSALNFIDLSTKEPEHFLEWDLSAESTRLKRPHLVQVNEATDTFFIRSTFNCPSCHVTNSSVFSATKADGEHIKRCKSKTN